MVGLSRLELLTSRLSGVRSNQLSYRPMIGANARSLRLTVSCHQILRSTYLSVRLPWICRHSLLSIKAFASLSVTCKGEIFVYSCVIQINSAVNVPFSTLPLNLFSFLALRKTFALLCVSCERKIFAPNFVMPSNTVVNVLSSTSPLHLSSFLVIHQSFCFASCYLRTRDFRGDTNISFARSFSSG